MPELLPFLENLAGIGGYPVVGGAFVDEVDVDLTNVVWIEGNTTTGGKVVRVDFSEEPTPTQVTNTEASGATWDFRDRVPRGLADIYSQFIALSPENKQYWTDIVCAIMAQGLPTVVLGSGIPLVVFDYVDP